MKRVIETQVRLLIGTAVMWMCGIAIFGANLTLYGVTSVIRWAFYIEGAMLIVTSVGWIKTVFAIIRDLIAWLVQINQQYRIFEHTPIPEEEIVRPIVWSEEKEEIEETSTVFTSETQKQAAEKFLLEVEEEIRKRLPEEANSKERGELYRITLDEEKKREFDALFMAADSIETARMILTGPKFFQVEKSKGKINGQETIFVLKTDTVEEEAV